MKRLFMISYFMASYSWVVGASQAVGQMQQLIHCFFWNIRCLQEMAGQSINLGIIQVSNNWAKL